MVNNTSTALETAQLKLRGSMTICIDILTGALEDHSGFDMMCTLAKIQYLVRTAKRRMLFTMKHRMILKQSCL